ncbi:hypothetical protein AMECASPLE_027572 [Ameca splendens]|uniref:Uncharacterized protein n=1 Tax=Ameca splendens TaxID=208324 RepID=A0ABV0Z4S6_9TELE
MTNSPAMLSQTQHQTDAMRLQLSLLQNRGFSDHPSCLAAFFSAPECSFIGRLCVARGVQMVNAATRDFVCESGPTTALAVFLDFSFVLPVMAIHITVIL